MSPSHLLLLCAVLVGSLPAPTHTRVGPPRGSRSAKRRVAAANHAGSDAGDSGGGGRPDSSTVDAGGADRPSACLEPDGRIPSAVDGVVTTVSCG